MTQAFFLDFDGTIIDSMPSLTQIAVDVIHKHYGITKSKARKLYLETTGYPFKEQLIKALYYNPLAEKEFEYRKRMPTLAAKPFPGAIEFINSHQDSKIFVVSSTKQELVGEVINKHLPRMISGYSGIEYGDKFTQIMNFLNWNALESSQCILIGDSLSDGIVASRCQMEFKSVLGEESWKNLITTIS